MPLFFIVSQSPPLKLYTLYAQTALGLACSRPLTSRLSYFAFSIVLFHPLNLHAQTALSLFSSRPLSFWLSHFAFLFVFFHPLNRRLPSFPLGLYPLDFLTLPFRLCFSPAQSARGGPFAKPFLLGKKIYLLKPRRFSVAQQNSKFQS